MLENNNKMYIDDLKWYKTEELVSNSFRLELNNLKAQDSGVYKCATNSKFLDSAVEFEISILEEKKPEIFFNFIENDIRPFGEVLVICESRSKLKSIIYLI